MELGLLLMKMSQIFCVSTGALEKVYKVSKVLLLMTYKTKLKAFWVFSLDEGDKSRFHYAEKEQQEKIIIKCLLNRKENEEQNRYSHTFC